MSGLEKVSALCDGELAVADQARVLDTLASDQDVRAQWQCYQLIGEGLRSAHAQLPWTADLTVRVMAQLAHEVEHAGPVVGVRPTVMPEHELQRPAANQARWSRRVSGLAAALSGVAVVAWLALSAPGAEQAAGTSAPLTAQMAVAQPSAAAAEPVSLAAASPASAPLTVVAAAAPQTAQVAPLADAQADELRTYLMAHQAYASAHRFEGGAAYVRTVAAQR